MIFREERKKWLREQVSGLAAELRREASQKMLDYYIERGIRSFIIDSIAGRPEGSNIKDLVEPTLQKVRARVEGS